ncbi:MAG: agenet domain-containing protein [Byssovorax sp.]
MFNIGQHVTAQWTNGNWYGARVLQVNGNFFEVAWDDGSPNLWIGSHQIRPDASGGMGAPMSGGMGAPMSGGGQFMPGQHVRAQWTNGGMYGARILRVNGSHYEVAWDDGSPNLWVAAHQIQPDQGGGMGAPMSSGMGAPMSSGGQYMPGQHVRAQWTNGGMYGARILQGNGSHYEVAWDDGSPNLWVAAHQIQPDQGGGMGAPMGGGGQYMPGQHVRAQWTNGGMYGARIVNQRGDHYEVAWDDGSPNLWVAAHQIQPDQGGGAPMLGGMTSALMGAAARQPRPGEHVVAQWTNGNWYGARVLNQRGDHYEVAWDDGSPNLGIGAHQIRLG